MTLRLVKGSEPCPPAFHGFAFAGEVERTEKLNRVIQSIYQAVLEVDPWRQCMDHMRDLFQSFDATIVVRPSSSRDMGYLVSVPGQPAVENAYRAHWYQLDPFVDLPTEQPMLLSDRMSEQQWMASPFYRDFLKDVFPLDTGHVLGVNVMTRAGTVSRVRLHRDMDSPPFSEDDKTLLGLLVPHIKQAMTLAAQVNRNECERELYEEALDRLNIGVLVLDENGQLLRANPTACHILNGADGLKLVDRRIEGCSRTDTRELRRLLDSALEHGDAVMAASLSRAKGRRGLGVAVRGIPLIEESEGRARPAVAVFLRDPDAPTSAPRDILRQLFDFTPAESMLAIELADGHTLDEAAERLGIRRNTARAHLRAIFSKAGVGRQTELVRVLLNGVIGLSIAKCGT